MLMCVVAMLRRGTALVNLKLWQKAATAMEQLLQIDVKNKKAQEMLSQARKELGQAKKKGRRVQIEEVEEGGEETSLSATTQATSIAQPDPEARPSSRPEPEAPPPSQPEPEAPPPVMTAPMPEDVKQWKETGNDLFRRGQYAEAVQIYSMAVTKLNKGEQSAKL